LFTIDTPSYIVDNLRKLGKYKVNGARNDRLK